MDGAKRWGRGGCSIGLGLDVVNLLVKEYNRRYKTGLNKANVSILSKFISISTLQPRPGHVAGTAEAGSGGGEEEEVSASARNNRYSATSGRSSSAELQLRTHS